MTIRMLDPTGTDDRLDTRMAARDGRLAGRRVGLLANGKPKAGALLRLVGDLLQERHGVAAVVFDDKRDASRPAPAVVLDRLLQQCDLVVTAIGD